MVLLSIAQEAKLIGFDIDELMLKKAKERIESSSPPLAKEERNIEYVHGNYADIVEVLA